MGIGPSGWGNDQIRAAKRNEETYRATRGTRSKHAQSLKKRSFNWPAAILAFILVAGVVGGLIFLYQITGAADGPGITP